MVSWKEAAQEDLDYQLESAYSRIIDKVEEVIAHFDYQGYWEGVSLLKRSESNPQKYNLHINYGKNKPIPFIALVYFDLLEGGSIIRMTTPDPRHSKEAEAYDRMINNLIKKLNRETSLLRLYVRKIIEES